MKKIFRSMILSALLVLTLSTSVFANPVSDIRTELLSIGVPKNYVATIVEYLQKTTINEKQYHEAMVYVNQAKKVIGNETNLDNLTESKKIELHDLAIKVGKVLGVNVQFSKNNQGVTVLTITDLNGNTLLQLTTFQVIDLVTKFDMQVLVDLLEAIIDFSNDTDKGKYDPMGGELNQTATPYGNIMVLGAGLVAIAGGVFAYSKKQFA